MMQRTCFLLSPKKHLNSHPRNAVRWRPGTKGFYKPKYGATKMKSVFQVPYVREVDSLFHYPEQSRVTGRPINWYSGEPTDGYNGSRVYGDHTLELQGMPKGRTPEYMQERLRRFFSKFGPVVQCRAEPHSHDPYQCEGTAYVSFRDKDTALKALAAPLKFPASLHDKVISMKHLDSDKKNDPDYYEKAKFWNGELLALARQLHTQLCSNTEWREGGKPLAMVSRGLFERERISIEGADATQLVRGRGGIPVPRKSILRATPTRLVPARDAVTKRFGSWGTFLSEPPFDELFQLQTASVASGSVAKADATNAESDATSSTSIVVVLPRLVSAVQRVRLLARARMALQTKLHEEFSVYWREGKVALPEYTKRRVEWWDHTPKLPFDLQIMSRSKDVSKIFDERFIYRQQLVRARNERRKENRSKWTEERAKMLAEKKEYHEARREKAFSAVGKAGCSRLLGRGLDSPRLSSNSR